MADLTEEELAARETRILQFPPNTYNAKLFSVDYGFSHSFKVAGTLDGFIDLATPQGTWPLSITEARELANALNASIADVEDNCLYDRDALLEKENK
jgi:hypothetical protein